MSSYITSARLSAFVIVPLFALLAVNARDVVMVLAGPPWMEITVLVEIMALAQIVTSLMFLRGAALTAVGRPDINIVTACVDVTAALLLLVLLAPWGGAVGASAAWAARIAATIPIGAILLRRHTGLGFFAILAASRQPLLAAGGLMLAVVMAAAPLAEMSPWLRLLLTSSVGMLVYALILWIVEPGFLRQVRQLIRGVAAAA